jgi:predicted secreted hydrolase
MRVVTRACAVVTVLALATGAGYHSVTEPRAFHFPRDHASHPDYRVEWWYYTGNVAAGSRWFGYQLTFFRVGIDPAWRQSRSAWAPHDVLFAHLALTDPSRGRYQFHERIERPALSMAGADTARYRVWIDDWTAALLPDGRTHLLQARAPDLALDLRLTPSKPPVFHGAHGLSRKSAVPGNASYYYSFTRLATTGRLQIGPEALAVQGESWMDHEFSTSQLDSSQVGWDWFSIQLGSGEELMLYQLRHRDGSIEALSSGTWVARDGRGTYLPRAAFTIDVTQRWRSPHSGADYPHGWRVRVPSLGLDVTIEPAVDDQELNTRSIGGVIYWEGAVTIRGTRRGAPVQGRGYVELTGYAGATPGLGAGR